MRPLHAWNSCPSLIGAASMRCVLPLLTIESISTFRSEIAKDKGLILVAFAQGTTPATLAILALSYNLPLSGSFLTLVTYIIIFTNIITTVGAFSFARKRGSKPEKLMSPKANKV